MASLYTHKSYFWLRALYPGMLWRLSDAERVIYLTFDDGPVPEATPFVLEQLRNFQAKATFFVVGHNVDKNPYLLQQILAEGHAVGNHTYNHLNAWNHNPRKYWMNVQHCQDALKKVGSQQVPGFDTRLFRPPYGKLTPMHSRLLKKSFSLVLWDVLTADFDQKLSPAICLAKAQLHTEPGSIVLFHDSVKSYRNMSFVLPRFLSHFHRMGFRFLPLPMMD